MFLQNKTKISRLNKSRNQIRSQMNRQANLITLLPRIQTSLTLRTLQLPLTLHLNQTLRTHPQVPILLNNKTKPHPQFKLPLVQFLTKLTHRKLIHSHPIKAILSRIRMHLLRIMPNPLSRPIQMEIILQTTLTPNPPTITLSTIPIPNHLAIILKETTQFLRIQLLLPHRRILILTETPHSHKFPKRKIVLFPKCRHSKHNRKEIHLIHLNKTRDNRLLIQLLSKPQISPFLLRKFPFQCT